MENQKNGGRKVCPQCTSGSTWPWFYNFCPIHGLKINPAHLPPSDHSYCQHCGQGLRNDATQIPPSQSGDSSQPQISSMPGKCHACGSDTQGQIFCRICNAWQWTFDRICIDKDCQEKLAPGAEMCAKGHNNNLGIKGFPNLQCDHCKKGWDYNELMEKLWRVPIDNQTSPGAKIKYCQQYFGTEDGFKLFCLGTKDAAGWTDYIPDSDEEPLVLLDGMLAFINNGDFKCPKCKVGSSFTPSGNKSSAVLDPDKAAKAITATVEKLDKVMGKFGNYVENATKKIAEVAAKSGKTAKSPVGKKQNK